MKKKRFQLILLLVLLAGALGGYLLLMQADDVAEELPIDTGVYVLGGFPQPYVKQVEIQNSTDRYVIENLTDPLDPESGETAEETLCTIQGFDADEVGQSALRNILSTCGSLQAKKTIEGAPATYGLDAPVSTLTVTYDSGEVTMLVGDLAPGGEGTYVSVDGVIYLVPSNKLTGVEQSRYYFASKTVTPGNSQTTVIESLELSGTAFDSPYAMERIPQEERDAFPWPSSHRLTAPLQSGADASAVTALQTLYGLTATEVVDADPSREDLARYGLDEPYLRAQVSTAAGDDDNENRIDPFTLLLAAPDEEGLAYAQCSASRFVYRVDTASLPFLGFDTFGFLEKVVFSPDLDRLSEVEVLAGNETTLFTLLQQEDSLDVIMNGAAIDLDDFEAFYSRLTQARYESVIPVDGVAAAEGGDTAQQEQPTGELILQYTYRYRDGSPDNVVRFYTGTARRYPVSLDGGTAYYTQSLYVDQVLDHLSDLAATGDIVIIGGADGPTTTIENGEVVGSTHQEGNYNP